MRRWISIVRPVRLHQVPLVALSPGAGQHGVLGGDPSLPLALLERRDPVLDGRGDEHMGVAEGEKAGAFGELAEASLEGVRTKLVESTAVGAHPLQCTRPCLHHLRRIVRNARRARKAALRNDADQLRAR